MFRKRRGQPLRIKKVIAVVLCDMAQADVAAYQQLKTLKEDLLKNKNITDKVSKIEKLLNKKCKDT
jgi:uncharacterized protein YigA (DUF484 family)